jgi:hypothetical protein
MDAEFDCLAEDKSELKGRLLENSKLIFARKF